MKEQNMVRKTLSNQNWINVFFCWPQERKFSNHNAGI